MLVPFFQVGHVLLVLRMIFLNQLLQKDLQVGLIFRKGKPECTKEGISICLDFRQGLVF